MIGICGNPLCLCRKGIEHSVKTSRQQEWAPYTEAESAALSNAVREFADKHGIELEEE